MLTPVLCDNTTCGDIWFTERIAGGSATIIFENCKVGPCPTCSGMGSIPDGSYSPVAGFLTDVTQWQRLAFALGQIRDAIQRGDSVEDVKKQIDDNHEIATYLKQFIPQNLQDLKTLLVIIGMVIAALTFRCLQETPVQMQLPSPAADVVNQIVNPDGHTDSHTQPTEDTPQSSTPHQGCLTTDEESKE